MDKNEMFKRGRNISLVLFHAGMMPDVASTVLGFQDELQKYILEQDQENAALRTRVAALEAGIAYLLDYMGFYGHTGLPGCEKALKKIGVDIESFKHGVTL